MYMPKYYHRQQEYNVLLKVFLKPNLWYIGNDFILSTSLIIFLPLFLFFNVSTNIVAIPFLAEFVLDSNR